MSYDFVLANVAARSNVYKDHYIGARQYKRFIMLDNGVFENDQIDVATYLELAKCLKPNVIIAPDTINADADYNWQKALEFAALVEKANFNFDCELMFVPQCEQGQEATFWRILDTALKSPKFQWIGICRDAVFNAFGQYTNTEEQELNRFYFVGRLQEHYQPHMILQKKWHFLGMGKHINLLPYYWFVDTMDTASLFYQGTLKNTLSANGIMPETLKRPRDYFFKSFMHEDAWQYNVEHNCHDALQWAQRADKLKRKLLGGRL
jgi:hypothetical protein